MLAAANNIEKNNLEEKESLKCAGCGCMFEVSAIVARLMYQWERDSGEPVVCALCVALSIGEAFDNVLSG